ncbi:GatB/YqeY domain-containing protein [Rhizobium sp. Nf11,1]|uniref:GatB/YqeY domain-containing protein n=1 Tax=Rhizobium sp. Nf11,1 TaxID=3404923 RepID=UPI003D3351E2
MLRDQLATHLKEAMKAKDSERLSTVRLIQAAIKDRDIANRGTGKEQASDDEILQILAKMVKQRDESAKIYEENSRPELAAKERAEIAVIQDFMPKQLSDGEVRANISAIITDTGAAGVKDMGKVMAALKERYAGQMDFAKASATVKELLNG